MATKFAKQDFTIAAIWRMGLKRGWGRAELASLLRDRARLTDLKANQLAGHWLTTAEYRQRSAA